MDDKLKRISNMEDLFSLWKDYQQNEKLENNKDLNRIDKSSFSIDGIIDNKFINGENNVRPILFIAKEPNVRGEIIDDNLFWLKNVYNEKTNETKFSGRIAMLANAYINNDYLSINKEHNGLKYVAFMNLNKRGGFSYCNYENLEYYTSKYRLFIKKQIELINPLKIICCGKFVKELLGKYIFTDNIDKSGYDIVEIYHPSYFVISDENYLNSFNIAIHKNQISCIEKNDFINKKDKLNRKGLIIDTNANHNS